MAVSPWQTNDVKSFIDVASNKLRDLIREARERNETSAELIIAPYLYGTSSEAVVASTAGEVWADFGQESIGTNKQISALSNGIQILVSQPATPKKDYRVTVTHHPENGGVLVKFVVSW